MIHQIDYIFPEELLQQELEGLPEMSQFVGYVPNEPPPIVFDPHLSPIVPEPPVTTAS